MSSSVISALTVTVAGSAIASPPRSDDLHELLLRRPAVVTEHTTHGRRCRDGSRCLNTSHRHAHVLTFQNDSHTLRVEVRFDPVGDCSGELFLYPEPLRHVLDEASELR